MTGWLGLVVVGLVVLVLVSSQLGSGSGDEKPKEKRKPGEVFQWGAPDPPKKEKGKDEGGGFPW